MSYYRKPTELTSTLRTSRCSSVIVPNA